MVQPTQPIEGTVSPKHQITIPAQLWEAMGLRAGDKIEFKLENNNVLELRVKRPTPSELIAAILKEHDVSALQLETKNDAVKTVRENRWGGDQ
jgi:antitoxin PrlF